MVKNKDLFKICKITCISGENIHKYNFLLTEIIRLRGLQLDGSLDTKGNEKQQ